MRKQFLICLTVAAMIVYSCIEDSGAINVIGVSNAAEAGFAPQVSNEREIKVTATLQGIPDAAKTWDFEVVLETHTKALNDDLAKSSVLVADGKQYLPLGWDGSPPGGHHRKGTLRFKAITPQPAAVELQIRLSGEPAPRKFNWPKKP